MTDDQLHAREEHPGFEYTVTKSPEHYPAGGQEGWHRNFLRPVDAEAHHKRIDCTYWKRDRRQHTPRNNLRNQYPMTIGGLFEDAGIRNPPGT